MNLSQATPTLLRYLYILELLKLWEGDTTGAMKCSVIDRSRFFYIPKYALNPMLINYHT